MTISASDVNALPSAPPNIPDMASINPLLLYFEALAKDQTTLANQQETDGKTAELNAQQMAALVKYFMGILQGDAKAAGADGSGGAPYYQGSGGGGPDGGTPFFGPGGPPTGGSPSGGNDQGKLSKKQQLEQQEASTAFTKDNTTYQAQSNLVQGRLQASQDAQSSDAQNLSEKATSYSALSGILTAISNYLGHLSQ